MTHILTVKMLCFSHTEIDDMIRKSANQLLTRTLGGCLSSLIKRPNLSLLQVRCCGWFSCGRFGTVCVAVFVLVLEFLRFAEYGIELGAILCLRLFSCINRRFWHWNSSGLLNIV